MTTKECFKCGAEKPLTSFYKHSRMADGHLNKCKECNKRDVRENRLAKVEYYREYDNIRWQKDKRRRAQQYERSKQWNAENPEKYKAHYAVANAVRDGRLVKKPCEVCGDEYTHGHHDDYSKPLDVRWLCPSHHRLLHLGRQ
jgi:hypothetical protein